MQKIVIDKPYQFIPPGHGHFWPWFARRLLGRRLRKAYGVTDIEFRGLERLRESVKAGHGVLLTPNHCRDCDPVVLGQMAPVGGRYFFMMASWHVFMQGDFVSWVLPRIGAFSIYREGMDRQAVNAAIDILVSAERPLVIFPEGVVSRANDRLNALLDGVSLIARTAAKKRAKMKKPGRVVVHPVAMRYTFGGDFERTLDPVLTEFEQRLTWPPQRHLSPVQRIGKIGEGLLSLKEIEYLDRAQPGDVFTRLERLVDHLLIPLEAEWLDGERAPHIIARVKALRTAILPDMIKGAINEQERQRRWKQLSDVYLAQQLAFYPPHYVGEGERPERMLETVERFEEDLTDRVRPYPPIKATVTVDEPIDVNPGREHRGGADPLMQKIEERLRALLEIGPGPAANHEPTPAVEEAVA